MPLLISIFGLVGCSPESELEKITVINCDSDKNLTLSPEEIYYERYPWIYNTDTGQVYDYDSFYNEFYKLDTWEDSMGYKSKYRYTMEGAILKVEETTISPIDGETESVIFLINPETLIETSYPKDEIEAKTFTKCVELQLPPGVTIRE